MKKIIQFDDMDTINMPKELLFYKNKQLVFKKIYGAPEILPNKRILSIVVDTWPKFDNLKSIELVINKLKGHIVLEF